MLPLNDMLGDLVLFLASFFIIVGGSIPYIPQYLEIRERENAQGFSLIVCLVLCVANILRIDFWFGKHFEWQLVAQSICMLITMVLMLEISVRMNRKHIAPPHRSSIWSGHLVNHFWAWNDLSSYLVVLAVFSAISGLITLIFIEHMVFVEALGMVALLVEANLATAQLIRNCKRRSTTGMSVKMVLLWFMGDCGKALYFVVRKAPAQFWLCALLQITIDILILIQVRVFRSRTPHLPYSEGSTT